MKKRLLLLQLLTLSIIILLLLTHQSTTVKAQQTTAHVSIQPENQTIQPGETANINILIDNADNLGGFEFLLTYNPAILNITSAGSVTLGSVLGSTGRTATLLSPIIDNTNGQVSIGAFSFGTQTSPSGSGTLVTITFNTVSQGTSKLSITDLMISTGDASPQIQPSNSTGGSITVGATSSPQPSVSPGVSPSITPSSTPGQIITANFTVLLQYIKTVPPPQQAQVRVYDSNHTQLLFNNQVTLTASDNQGHFTGSVTFNSTPQVHYFYIKGPVHLTRRFARSLTSGTNTLDLTDSILLGGDGDPDFDDIVNIFDFSQLVTDFGVAMPTQGSTADFDLDHDVDIFDFTFIVENFGLQGDISLR